MTGDKKGCLSNVFGPDCRKFIENLMRKNVDASNSMLIFIFNNSAANLCLSIIISHFQLELYMICNYGILFL